MKIVRTAIGVTPYEATVTAGRHTLTADEPESRGGRDAGPAPYDLLLAGLGACSAITLKMYAERKQLTLRSLEIDLTFHREGERGVIERTPVTLTLKAGSDIRTEFAAPFAVPGEKNR
jgi:putative redox protein